MTGLTFVACLSGCINPKGVRLESDGTVVGRIIDARSRAPIAAATVHDELDRTAQADPDGAFSFTLPSGRHTLLIHADAYVTKRVTVKIAPHKTVLINQDGYYLMQRSTSP